MYHQGVKKIIVPRPIEKTSHLNNLEPIFKKIFASRGITENTQLDRSLTKLPSPWLLSGMETMVEHLISTIKQQQRITIVADFDVDGATSCVVAMKGLALLGAQHINYVVPNRFEYGYGLTPEIVKLAKQQNPDVIITVDNGISSFDGVKVAHQLGIKVLITDHHLPADSLPDADAIVNPNLKHDNFPSKNMAGVGVMFYVLMALRVRLREQHWFEQQAIPEPNLAHLLDYVALGTIADVVSLDQINRIFVYQGLLRIRSGNTHMGIKALIEISNKQAHSLNATDFGFALGPRLNAAGRMDDMSVGIQCLLTDDSHVAKQLAEQLDALNIERKAVEEQMKNQAIGLLNEMQFLDEQNLPAGVCLYEKNWHQGVIGILASRIKDRVHRPVIAFAKGDKDEIKGSARSITGVHIRDVLSEIATSHPHILTKFGGHAMAAGLSIKLHDFPVFTLAFDTVVTQHLQHVDLEQKIYSDGQLSEQQINIPFTEQLQNAGTWGHAFPEPLFDGVFDVIQCRILKGQHLKFVLRLPKSDTLIDAIAFFVDKTEHWLGIRSIKAAYKCDINEFRGKKNVQLLLQYIEKII